MAPTCAAGAAGETVAAKMLVVSLLGVKALESAPAPEQRAAELGTAEPSTNCSCHHIRCNLQEVALHRTYAKWYRSQPTAHY